MRAWVRWRHWGLALVVLALAGCRANHGTGLAADRFDVAMTLGRDGSLRVRETVALHGVSASAPRFERTIAPDRADDVQFESASLDGRELAADDPTGRLTVRDGRTLRATWRLDARAGQQHVVTLSYRVLAATAVQGTHGHLEWTAIPPDRGYPIQASRLSLTIPDTADLFDGSGIAAAGWTVRREPHGISAERANLSPSESGTVIAEVSVDPSAVVDPVWQRDEAWQRDLMPALVSGGLFILVVGAGVLWIVSWQYPRDDLSLAQDRASALRALRSAGFISLVFAVLVAAGCWIGLPRVGLALQSIPASIFVVGLSFLIGARVLR